MGLRVTGQVPDYVTSVDGDRSDQKVEVDRVDIDINVDGETGDTVTGVDGGNE